jgi:hypothetical protein
MVHQAIPAEAERPNLLNGLVGKRAEIAGKLEANEAEHKRLANELCTLDATIRIFEPDVDLTLISAKPMATREAAHRGQITPIVFDALRPAETRLTSQDLAVVVLQRRGLPTDDPDLLQLMRKRVGACLLAKKRQGFVRSMDVGGPLLAWEMIR